MGCTVIVPAAGAGTRMGVSGGKLQLLLCGIPIIAHTLLALADSSEVDRIILAVREEDMSSFSHLVKSLDLPVAVTLVRGGATRAESVLAGLNAVIDSEWVLVHDGARCLVTAEEIQRVATAVKQHGAAAVGVRVKDTVKVCNPSGKIVDTPERSTLWAVQTPQGFRTDLLRTAFAQLSDFSVTDDCAVCERAGIPVYMVEGSYENIKITTQDDLIVAEQILLKRGN